MGGLSLWDNNHAGVQAMFDKIVLATDLSTDWDHVIGCAEDLRALGATQAVLTHVLVTRGLVGAGDVRNRRRGRN